MCNRGKRFSRAQNFQNIIMLLNIVKSKLRERKTSGYDLIFSLVKSNKDVGFEYKTEKN
jgi:hypothetical protein